MTIFWRVPPMLRAPATCKLYRTSAAPAKLVLPTRCRHVSSLQEMRLPPDKLARLRACLPAWRTRQKCTKREMLSLIGVLSFACKVVRPGRIFLRWFIDLSMTVPALAHHISLTAAARADIAWWVEFLPSWNGRAFFPAAARRRGGTQVCYRRERRGAWRGVRSEMALRGVAPRLPRLSYQCPGVVCYGGRCPLLGRGMA